MRFSAPGGRGRRVELQQTADRRLPRHHAGPGADQHRGAGAGARRDRAADHVPRRAGDRRHARGCEQLRSVSQFGLSQGGRDVRGRHGHLLCPAAHQRAAWTRRNARRRSTGPKWGPSRPAWAKCFITCVIGEGKDLTELRTAVRTGPSSRCMRPVPGTAEINSWGGFKKQYQVRIDPSRLIQYDLTFEEVIERRARRTTSTSAAATSTAAGDMLLVHGVGRTINVDADRQHRDHRPKKACRSASATSAEVAIGHEIRRGAGHGQRPGRSRARPGLHADGREQLRRHAAAWRDKLRGRSRACCPRASRIGSRSTIRTELVDQVIDTVRKNLFEGGLLVIVILFMFLGNLRAGLIVAVAIPLVDAVRLLRHAAGRHRRHAAEPGGDRLRHRRR